MRGFGRSVGGVLACLVLCACGTTDAGPDSPRLSVERELVIGSVDDPDQALTRVGNLTVDGAGTIFVGQSQDRQIRVFSRDGEFLRTIGREGEGPGEFGVVGFLGWITDTLYVIDRSNRRVSFFLSDGSFVRSIRLMSELIDDVFTPAVPTRMLSDGTALVQPSFPSRFLDEGRITASPLFRIDAEGKSLGRVTEFEFGNSRLSIVRDDGVLSATQPFSDAPLLGLPPSGDYAVVLERYVARSAPGVMRLHKVSLDGDTLFTREHSYDPLPLPRTDVDSVIGSFAETFGEFPMFGSERAARQALEEIFFVPAYYPAASRISVGSDGKIWLRREARSSSERRWDVLSPDGESLGHVMLPPTTVIHESQGELLWTSERDELDVSYVVRYRVHG